MKDRPDDGPAAANAVIEGRQPVREALRAGVPLTWVRIARGTRGAVVTEIVEAAKAAGVAVFTVDRRELDRQVPGRRHQGVVAAYAGFRYTTLDKIIDQARQAAQEPFLLLAAGVVDPQNLGSLLRTAAAAGVHGVVIPRHRATEVTQTVIRASAGAALHVPVAVVTNLSHAMQELKEAGLWLVAADPGAGDSLFDINLRGPIAVVVGAEGTGIPRLVREHCDLAARIPMLGPVGSLNAGVAGALIMYEVLRQRLADGPVRKG